MKKIIDNMPGVIVAFAIAFPAWKLGKMFPVVGGPVLGILFGMILAFFKRPAVLEKGIKYTSKKCFNIL